MKTSFSPQNWKGFFLAASFLALSSFWSSSPVSMISSALAQSDMSDTAAEDEGTQLDDSTAAEDEGTMPEGESDSSDDSMDMPPPDQEDLDAENDPNLTRKQWDKANEEILKHQKPMEEDDDDGASADCTYNCAEQEREKMTPTH